MKLANKIVIVTGAGSGIGRAVALQVLQRGGRVAAVDVNAATLDETAALAGDAAHLAPFVVDVADRAAVDALPAKVIARFGVVDGLIHCAGIIQPFVRLNELSYEAIDRVFAVNWYGTLFLMKALLPHLLARPIAHVVNVSSMGGFLPVPGQTIYGASKAAVKLLTEGLAAELRGTPVHVTIVFPGAVATNITANSGVTLKLPPAEKAQASRMKTTTADDAATAILDGMEADAYRVLVGPDAKLMDRLVRLDPRRAAMFIARRMKSLLG
jgi:NAD(P)-dependent dehydrogenase (short-subunit alcohol dehydrogenase family)